MEPAEFFAGHAVAWAVFERIHHLEIHGVQDVDDEVVGWLEEAAERAS